MSVFTEERELWNTTLQNNIDGRPAHLRRSSLSSDSSSGSSDLSELSEASTNTLTSITTASTFEASATEGEYVFRDDQAGWRPLSASSAPPKEEDLSLSSSHYLTTLGNTAPQNNPGCLNSFIDPQSSCVAHATNPLTHLLLATEHIANESDMAQSQDASAGSQRLESSKSPSRPSANPRRTSAPRSWSKPTLERQVARKQDFVMYLVGKSDSSCWSDANVVESACQLVSHIWPEPATVPAIVPATAGAGRQPRTTPVISLRFFIQETLRRSHATYSTLTMSLYYLSLLKVRGKVPSCDSAVEVDPAVRSMKCGRRVFLSALILSSKYLQDRNYSAKAWSKITSLTVKEINSNERTVLNALDFNLHLPPEKYNEWCAKVSECVDAAAAGKSCPWEKMFEPRAGSSSSSSTSSSSSSSRLSTPTSIMSALKDAPAVGIQTLSSTMPHLGNMPGFTAPRLASLARQATFPSTARGYVGTPSSVAKSASKFIDHININLPSPASLTSSDELPLAYSEQSSFHQSQSPPAFLQATHLPTPPSSLPSIPSSAEEYPLDSPPFGGKNNSSQADFADLLASRVAALTHQHGLSPPWSTSSRAGSQEDFSLSSSQSTSFSSHNDDKLPAIASLLRSGLKAHLNPVVGSQQALSISTGGRVQCGTKRPRGYSSDADDATCGSEYGMLADCIKKVRTC